MIPNNVFESIKTRLQKLILIVQKILICALLFLVYLIGVGATLVLTFVFNPKALGIGSKKNSTFWKQATGYDADIDDCMRQS